MIISLFLRLNWPFCEPNLNISKATKIAELSVFQNKSKLDDLNPFPADVVGRKTNRYQSFKCQLYRENNQNLKIVKDY